MGENPIRLIAVRLPKVFNFMRSELGDIRFIGENSYYPRWARGSARWVFQHTLVMIDQIMGGIVQLRAMEVLVSH